MIVIAIVSILGTLAVSAYTAQVMRAKVAEGISLVNQYARIYEEYYSLYGYLPKSMPETLLVSPNTSNVAQIWAGSNSSQGTGMFIYIVLQDSLGLGINNRVVLILLPDPTGRVINKHCGQWQTTLYVPVKYLPSTCDEQAMSTTYATQLVN